MMIANRYKLLYGTSVIYYNHYHRYENKGRTYLVVKLYGFSIRLFFIERTIQYKLKNLNTFYKFNADVKQKEKPLFMRYTSFRLKL